MAVERPDGVRLPTEAKGRTLAGGDDGDWRGVLEEVGQEGPTMVCQEVKGHGVGSLEDAEPAHNGFDVRRLVMLVWDSNGCPKSSEEGILVDGVSAVGHQGQPAEDYSLAAILRVLRDVLVEGEHMGLRRPLAGELPTGVAEDVAQGEEIAAAAPEMSRRESVQQVDRSPADEAC